MYQLLDFIKIYCGHVENSPLSLTNALDPNKRKHQAEFKALCVGIAESPRNKLILNRYGSDVDSKARSGNTPSIKHGKQTNHTRTLLPRKQTDNHVCCRAYESDY